jgi:hypothetical protein
MVKVLSSNPDIKGKKRRDKSKVNERKEQIARGKRRRISTVWYHIGK